jgi:hypothetical protein
MNKLILVSALTALFGATAFADPVVTCSQPSWIEPAAIVNGIFVAKLVGTCDITGMPDGSIEKLYQYYQAQESVNVVTVNSAPRPDTSLAATGTTADLTLNMDDGTMQSLIRMGTDNSTLFLYKMESEEIHFTGFAALMQKLDIDIKVDKLSADHFQVTLKNLTEVKKPNLMPSFTFLGPARSKSLTKFQTSLDKLGSDVALGLK